MTQAIIQTNLDELLADCGTIDTVSWQAPKHMTYAQWAEIGSKFQYISGSLNWWLGDWINEGEKRYGETYTQAIEVTGHKTEHLKQCAGVARAVKKCTRVHDLSWTHHRHVAHLDEIAQQQLLHFAAEHDLSSREILEAVRQYEANIGQLSSTDEPPYADDTAYQDDNDEDRISDNWTEDDDPPYADQNSQLYDDQIVAVGEKEILAVAKEIRQRKAEQWREERIEKINEISRNNTPIDTSLDRLYPVIYADPPWRYEHSQTISREIENQYPTMSLEDICALPVADIASPDSLLYLWTTSPKLEESMQVIKAWGFTYRTCLVWVKDKIGMGYYARQRHEILLVAKRGEFPVPESSNRFDSVIESPRTEHSTKPDVVYDMIEQMHPEFDKLELFARNTREGWAAWGNQA